MKRLLISILLLGSLSVFAQNNILDYLVEYCDSIANDSVAIDTIYTIKIDNQVNKVVFRSSTGIKPAKYESMKVIKQPKKFDIEEFVTWYKRKYYMDD